MAEITAIGVALTPVFALVLMGLFLKRINFPGHDFWPLAERFTYFILFPILLVLKIGGSDLPVEGVSVAITSLIFIAIGMSCLVVALCLLFKINVFAGSSFFQGSIRFNTYVGLAAASELYGEVGIIWGALFLGVMVPLVNILSVLFFVVGSQETKLNLKSLVVSLVKNPLILACLIGAFLNLSGLGIPAPAIPIMELLSQMALPLGLLAVGVGIDLKLIRKGSVLLWGSSGLKLLVYPFCYLILARYMNLPIEAIAVFMVFASLPTAPSSYILARQMGGNAPLMAAIITFQTILSAFTIPLALWLVANYQ